MPLDDLARSLAARLKLKRPLVCFDLESTGKSPGSARIVQVALVKIFPNGEIEQWESLVNPEQPIPEAATTDEVFVTFQGRRQYLWRAVDQDGDVLDILVQSRRDRRAAARFFRKVLKGQGRSPRCLVTDKLRSYSAAPRTVMPSVVHNTRQYANNRAEVSHQPTRQRERQMRRFKSAAHAQRFLSVHGLVLNLFRVGRHLLRSAHHRLLRMRAFAEWDAVTCAC